RGVGGLTITSQPFGQATISTLSASDAYDGILGLAPSSFNWPGVGPLVNAKKQGIIAKNVVTIALIREGVHSPDLPGGTITYGDVDKKNCGDVAAYVPAFNENGYPSDLSLEGITFGGVVEKPAAVAWRGDLSFDT
ncbi:CBN-ASP-6 protein, partial [Aphelenchoides avenae]